jgi:hypothetical protein
MSRLVARILLAMLMFPLAVMLYALTVAVEEMILAAGGVTWAGVATYWCLLWRSSIRWTSARVRGTLVAAGGAVVVGGGVAFVISGAFVRGGDAAGFILFLGGVLAILLWLFATVFLWRETTAERAARVGATGTSTVTCPACGYNLTGLTDARCPECGGQFTLNELLAAQPARVAAADLD